MIKLIILLAFIFLAALGIYLYVGVNINTTAEMFSPGPCPGPSGTCQYTNTIEFDAGFNDSETGITPGTTPGITPGITPGTTQGITPGTTRGTTPGTTRGGGGGGGGGDKPRYLDGNKSGDYKKDKDSSADSSTTDSIYDVKKLPFGADEMNDLITGGGGTANSGTANSGDLLNSQQSSDSLANATSAYNSDGKGQTCPDTLAFKDGQYTLYFKSDPTKQPVTFGSMDEYGKYNQEQRKAGNDCPVLFVRQEFDAQGNAVMRTAQSPFMGGKPQLIDADRENPPYNKDNYPGFDPTGLYNGVRTVLDEIHDVTAKRPVSDNPLDPNWGGVQHTQVSVDSGKYDGSQVTKPSFSRPLRDTMARPVIA